MTLKKVGYVLPAYSDVGRTYAVHPPVVFYPACPIARVFLGAKGAYAGMLNRIVHVLLVTHTRSPCSTPWNTSEALHKMVKIKDHQILGPNVQNHGRANERA